VGEVFENSESVFFMGGTVGDGIAGGYTRSWLDANSFTEDGEFDVSTIMGENNAPLATAVGATWDKSEQTLTKAGAFEAIDGIGEHLDGVGLVVYVEDNEAELTNGFYEITAVTANTITLRDTVDGDSTDDSADVDCWVGGAWWGISDAQMYAGTTAAYHPCTIWTCKDHTPPAHIHLALAIGGTGTVSKNTRFMIKAFYQSPGDMSVGGAYYGNAADAYRSENGIDPSYWDNPNAKWLDWDFNGGGYNGVELDNIDNFVLEGINLHNVRNADKYLIYPTNTAQQARFNGCKFNGAVRVIPSGQALHFQYNECWSGTTFDGLPWYGHINSGTVWSHCVLQGKVGQWLMYTGYYDKMEYCVIVGTKGIQPYRMGAEINNCTFVNCTVAGINPVGVGAAVNEWNNFFVVPADDDYAVLISDGVGSVRSDYSYAVCTAGAFAGNAWHDATHNRSIKGPHSTATTDPTPFVDITHGDFRPVAAAIYAGGRPDIEGRASCIGALVVVDVPSVGDVEAGVQYGGDGTEFTGTFVVPAEDDVRLGSEYGESGEFTGTYDITAPTTKDYGAVSEILTACGAAVQYYAADGSPARQIYAIIAREPTEQIGGIAGAMASGITIRVANNSDIGISSDELDTGGDEVELPVRIGGVQRRRRILAPLEPGQEIDGQTGMLKLAVT